MPRMGGRGGGFSTFKGGGIHQNWNIAGKLSVGAIGGSKEKAPVSPLYKTTSYSWVRPSGKETVVFRIYASFSLVCVGERGLSSGRSPVGFSVADPFQTPKRLLPIYSSSFV